jgi:predicted GH43/DUF377 family glycosyl hydrolase
MRLAALIAVVVALAAPSLAQACSKDDAVFYETFLDTSCLQLPLTNTTLDALGGLRLTTNGTAAVTAWDTDLDFDNGITHESVLFAPVGVRTLARTGTGSAAALTLPTTLLPLSRDAASPVVRPTAATVLDNDNVDDPTVVKVGGQYQMWYSGTAEDGSGPALFLATSTDGTIWARANGGNPVLTGTAGAFDQDGVFGADVVYDPTDTLAPYKMWYSGKADVFGGIGYATSLDGVAWTKYTGSETTPVAVLNHGPAGSADSFSAADPSVLKDGSTWKMWYTGDDSNKKRIAYATSTDGVSWAKGGKVLAPEDPGVSANVQFGAFAPTVWKTATGYSMLLSGRKIVGGGVYQTKILSSSSVDGVSWSNPSPAVNPSGTNTNFDYSNLNAPDLLSDPDAATPFKLYYSGNTLDANGNFHTRIGLATSNNASSFSKVNGAQAGGSVLDVGTLGTSFDARQTSGLSVAAPGGGAPKFAGFYWGTRGSDFKPRLGEATSSDGSSWTKIPVPAGAGGAVFADAVGNTFDKGGDRDPSVLYDAGTYDLYFTGIDASGVSTIGLASTPEVGGTKQPNNASWSARSNVLGVGSGFDANDTGHPSVIKDGASYVMYYTGTDASGVMRIGRATATAAGGPFTRGASAVLDLGAAGSFDATDVKDPVVQKVAASDYRMLYTGVETLDGKTIERIGYATSTDGVSWTKRGVVLDPSQKQYADDEVGVEPTGMLVDGASLHVWSNGVDGTGRTRGDHLTTAYPTPGSPQPGIPSGWATYQLGDSSTSVRDFRQIARTSSGSGVTLWMSFLQPYSSSGNEFWSNYFPVTASSATEALNFLLTVRGVRWQARLSNPAGSPSLDKVELTHAPVSFSPSGGAGSITITPSAGRMVSAWRSLTVNTTLFSPTGAGTGSATARMLDASTGVQVASTPLSTGGDTVLDLSGIPVAAHQSLRAAFDLQSANGQATPRINSFKVLYSSAPLPPPVLTLATTTPGVVYGQPATLTGTLMQNGAPLAGQTVTVLAQPLGTAGFTPAGTATTDASGAFIAAVNPDKLTTYEVGFAGVTSSTVSVAVQHLVTLNVVRKRGKGYFRGRVGPSHPARLVVIQLKKGSGWVTFTKVKTSSRSTFAAVKKLKMRAKYRFRATTAADAEHLAGTSPVVYVVKQKVSLKVVLKGRKAILTGTVTPPHPGKPFSIKMLVGTSTTWVTLAKGKLSSKSTFRLVRKLKPGSYQLRAETPDDRDHFGGQSAVRKIVVS